MRITLAAVRRAASKYGIQWDENFEPRFNLEFKTMFGTIPGTVRHLWNAINDTCEELNPSHVIWIMAALSFLAPTQPQLLLLFSFTRMRRLFASTFGGSPSTSPSWKWYVLVLKSSTSTSGTDTHSLTDSNLSFTVPMNANAGWNS